MSGPENQQIERSGERSVTGSKGQVTGVSDEEYLRMQFLAAMDAARRTRLDRDRAGELSRARKHIPDAAKMGKMGSFGQGFGHGFLHGFTDDYERMSVDPDARGSERDLKDKIYQATGQRMAVNNVIAKANHPLSFNIGQMAGMGSAAFGTRGALQGLGQVRKRINKSRFRDETSMIPNDPSMRSPTQSRRFTNAESDLAERNARAESMGRGYLKTNRGQAQVFDAGHGALLGFGGVDVMHDEDVLSPERGVRAALGGAAGYAFAPAEAATFNFIGQGSKYAQQQLGLNPRTPLRRAKLRDDVTPEDALRQALSQDEAAARRTREDGEGLMQGDQENPLLYAEGESTRGVVDHAIASRGGADAVIASQGGMQGRTARKRLGRVAEAPGGGVRAREAIDAERSSLGREVVGDRIARGTPERPEPYHPATHALAEIEGRAPMTQKQVREREKVDALMEAFDASDGPVAKDWGLTAKSLSRDGRQLLRHEIGRRLSDIYDGEGVEGVVRFVNDPEMAKFFEQPGLRGVARWLRQGGTKDPQIVRLTSILDDVAAREAAVPITGFFNKRPVDPHYAHKKDQKLARYEMDEADARGIAEASLPGSSFDIPDYVPPANDPRRMLTATRAPFKDYMREAWKDTKAKFTSEKDFSVGDVTVGGMGAGVTEVPLEEHLIAPIVERIFSLSEGSDEEFEEMMAE